MKRNSILRKALVLMAMLSLLLVLLIGCGKTTSDMFNQFVSPEIDVNPPTPAGNKVAVSGESAVQMLFDSIVKAQAAGGGKDNVIDFSFAPYFSVSKNGLTTKYTIDVRGSIDTDDNDKSVFSMEIISTAPNREDFVVLGIYGKDGEMYIDTRNYETGKIVHQYYVDDMNLAMVTKYLKAVLDQLDVAGFINRFSVKDMMNKLQVDANTLNILNGIMKLDGTLLELIFSLVASDGCTIESKGDGVEELIMPLKLNSFINSPAFKMIIESALSGQSDLVKGLINFLFGDLLNGEKTLNLFINAEIKDSMFHKAALMVNTKKPFNDGVYEKDYAVGIGGFAFSKDSNYAETLKKKLPELVQNGRKDYSFTTFSLDLELDINVAKHTYSLGTLDTALGGAIGNLLGTAMGIEWKQTEIDIAEDMVISLHLKLRAEIDLKDNRKTRIAVEILGKDDKLRAGIYYKGADNALYVDLSGMGGGKVKIDSYDKFEPDDNGDYVENGSGGYRLYVPADGDKPRFAKNSKPINLNEIIASALDKYIPEIPSILDLVNGKLGIGNAASESAEYNANMEAIREVLESGEVIVPHYGTSSSSTENSAVSAADGGGNVDILGLVFSILGKAEITKGDTRLSMEMLTVFMTQDVIDTIFKDALGLNLPITKLDLVLKQTRDEGREEGWELSVKLEMEKEEKQLLSADVVLYINYGNPDPEFAPAFDNKNFSDFIPVDFFGKDDAGDLDNVDVNVELEARIQFNMANGSQFDLSPFEQLLYGLALKLKADSEINVDLGVKLAANLNIAKLIKGGTDIKNILAALEARIEIGKWGEAYSAMIYISKGKLYLDAPVLGMPKYCIDIAEVLKPDFKFFSYESGSGAMATEANAAYIEDEEGLNAVALIIAIISGVKIDNSELEVSIADGLIRILLEALGAGWNNEITEITATGSGISITYEGLDLSQLWLQVDLKLQQGEGNDLGLGLGLGHIKLGVGRKDLTAGIVESDYTNLLEGGNLFLGLQLEIDLYLKNGEISLDNMLGALLMDAALTLPSITVDEIIDGGINLTLMFDLDLSSVPAQNDTKLLIELRKVSGGKDLILGLYYQNGELYINSGGTVFQKAALSFDLIAAIKGLIYKPAEGQALATADIDLSPLNPVLILSNKGIQLQVMQGITDLIFGLIVGDYLKSFEIPENGEGWRYYENNDKLEDAVKKAAEGYAAATYNKYVYIYNAASGMGEFEPLTDENATVTENGVVNTRKIWVKLNNFKLVKDVSADDRNMAVPMNSGADVPKEEYVLVNGAYILITAANAEQYKNAAKYYKFEYKADDSTLTEEERKESDGYVAETAPKLFQKDFDKYVYVDGKFVIADATQTGSLYAKLAEFYYLKEVDLTETQKSQAVGTAGGALVDGKPYKTYVKDGDKYVEITAKNAGDNVNNEKYLKFQYKAVEELVAADVKNIVGYGAKGFAEGFIAEGLPSYVRTRISAEDAYLYDLLSDGIIDGTEIQLNLPEIGAVVGIGKIANSDVSAGTAGSDFGGIGIGIFFTDKNADGTLKTEPTASLSVKIGNFVFTDAKFQEVSGSSLSDYIAAVKASMAGTPVVDINDIGNFTAYIQVTGGIVLGAESTAGNPDGVVSYPLGGILENFADKFAPAEQPGVHDKGFIVYDNKNQVIFELLKSIVLKFKVTERIEDVTGFRIAANLAIGTFLTADSSLDTVGKLFEVLKKSEVAIEIFDGAYVEGSVANRVLGIYIQDGWLFANIDGSDPESLIKNTKFKIPLDTVFSLVGNLKKDSSAAATEAFSTSAEAAAVSVNSVLGVISSSISGISITSSGLTVNLGANLLGAVIGLVAGVEGLELPILNEDNSWLKIDASPEGKDKALWLSLGIDPIFLQLYLGNFELGLAPKVGLIAAPADYTGEPSTYRLKDDTAYKSIEQLAENVSVKLEVGLDLGLKEGVLSVGEIASTIAQALGYDIEFPLNIDIQDTMEWDLRLQLATNLNLLEPVKSQVKLALVNYANIVDGKAKTIFGMYITPREVVGANGETSTVSDLYIETSFSNTPKWKIENFNLIDSLLGETLKSLIAVLGSETEGMSQAMATAGEEAPKLVDVLFELQEHSLKIKIAEDLIITLLDTLLPNGITEEIERMIEDIGLNVEVALQTKPIELKVTVDTNYFKLGVRIGGIQLSLEPLPIFKYSDGSNIDFESADWKTASDWDTESALNLEFGVKINYDISNSVNHLQAVLKDIAKAEMLGTAKMSSIGELLEALTVDLITNNTKGYIGVKIVLNVITPELNAHLPAVGKMLKDLVMGKLDPSYITSDDGRAFDALDLLNMIEAGIFISLNGRDIALSLTGGYVCVALSGVGGDNFKIPLDRLVAGIQKASASAATSEALATAEEKPVNIALINKILQNAISSITIGKGTGIDIAFAPQLLAVVFTDVLAEMLGTTFGDTALGIFTMTQPYVKAGEGVVSMDGKEYVKVDDIRYVGYNPNFESHNGPAQLAYVKDVEYVRFDAANAAHSSLTQYVNINNEYFVYDSAAHGAAAVRYVLVEIDGARVTEYNRNKDDHKAHVAGGGEIKVIVNIDKAYVAYDSLNPAHKDLQKYLKNEAGIYRRYVASWDGEGAATYIVVENADKTTSIVVYDNTNPAHQGLVRYVQDTAKQYVRYTSAYYGQDLEKFVINDTNNGYTPYVEATHGDRDTYVQPDYIPYNQYKNLIPRDELGKELLYVSVDVYTAVSDIAAGWTDGLVRYVEIGGEYVEYKAETAAHQGLTQFVKTQYVNFDENNPAHKKLTKYISIQPMRYIAAPEGYAGDIYAYVKGSFVEATPGRYEIFDPANTGSDYIAQKVSGAKYVKWDASMVPVKYVKVIGEGGTVTYVAYDPENPEHTGKQTYIQIAYERYVMFVQTANDNIYVDANEFSTEPNAVSNFVVYEETAHANYRQYRLKADNTTYVKNDTKLFNFSTAPLADGDKYIKVKHSGISWNKAEGLAVNLVFENGFSFGVGLKADLEIAGTKMACMPEGMTLDSYTALDNLDTQRLYVSLMLTMNLTGGAAPEGAEFNEFELTDLLQSIIGNDLISKSEFDALKFLGGLVLKIGEFNNLVNIRITLGANVAELMAMLTAGNINVAELLTSLEIAIESMEEDKTTVRGGLYLSNGVLYIDYVKDERKIFAINIKDVISALASGAASAAADPEITADLQLWLGEYVNQGGVASSGLAVKITTGLVEVLLQKLLGVDVDIASTFGKLEAEVSINVAKQVDRDIFAQFITGEGDVPVTTYKKVTSDLDLTGATGYNAETGGFNEFVSVDGNYVAKTAENAKEFVFDLESFAIGIGLQVGTLNVGLKIGNIDIGIEGVSQGSGGTDRVIVPQAVKNTIVPDEAVIDLSLNLDLGIEFLDQPKDAERNPVPVDLGTILNGLGLLKGTTIPSGKLLLNIPDGGVELKLSLTLALALNLNTIDKSVAEVKLRGKIISVAGEAAGYTEIDLISVYFKDGELLIDMSTLGFGKVKMGGLVLSNLLGATSGIEAIMNLFNSAGSGSSASEALSTQAEAAETTGAAIILDGKRLAIEIGSGLIGWILDLDALSDKLDPATADMLNKLGVKALIEIKYKDAAGDPDLEINLKPTVLDVLGLNISINTIRVGNTGVEKRVNEVNSLDYTPAARINLERGADGKLKADFEITLETLSLSLELNLNGVFTNGMFTETAGVDGEGNPVISPAGIILGVDNATGAPLTKGVKVVVNAEIAAAGLVNLAQAGFDTMSKLQIASSVLPLIKAQISFMSAAHGHELIGIYVVNGEIYVRLEGLGLPNVKIDSGFLMEILAAALPEENSGALATPAAVDTTQIFGILGGVLDGINLANKALEIALKNDYLKNLLEMLLAEQLKGDEIHLPDTDASAFSGIKINLGNLVDNSDGNGRDGLLQVDLDLYGTHLNVDLMLPVIGFNTYPVGNHGDESSYQSAREIRGLSLSLKGQFKIDKNTDYDPKGARLGNILANIVGDLDTRLVIEDGVDIRFEIAAAMGFDYSINEKTFSINKLDLKIALTRVFADNTTAPFATIIYNSADQALYLDISHFFQNQANAEAKNLGKLKITGIDIVSLLSGALSGSGSAVSDALASAADENAWNADHSKLYVPYDASEHKAPEKYVEVNVLTSAAPKAYVPIGGRYVLYNSADAAHASFANTPAMAFDNYKLSMENGVKETLYVKTGEGIFEAYDWETPAEAHSGLAAYAKIGNDNYAALYVKDKGAYTPYIIDNQSQAYRAKYVLTGITEYDTYNEANPEHQGLQQYVHLYNRDAGRLEFVVFNPNISAHIAPQRYNRDASGNYIKADDGTHVLVSAYSLSALWAQVDEDTVKLNITGKLIMELVGLLTNNQNIKGMLPNLAVGINLDTEHGFMAGVDISLLDVYNDYQSALSLHLNIFGFTYNKDGAGIQDGSKLEFAYNEIAPADKASYRQLLNIDIPKLLNAADVKDVLMEALDFGAEGKLFLNASIDFDAVANETGGYKYWQAFMANILGLNEHEIDVILDVDYSTPEAEWTNLSIDIAAAIDVENFLGGLISGTGLNLDGTEIQITMAMDSPHFAEGIRNSKVVITIIGKDTDGMTGVYIDLSGWRNKGKHKLSIDLASLLGGAVSASAAAEPRYTRNTGLIPDAKIWGILNALLGEVRLADGKISVGLNKTFLGDLLNTLAGLNVDETNSLVTGDVYIDIRNLALGFMLYFGEVATDPVTGELRPDIALGLRVGGINLAKPEAYNGGFIAEAEKVNFKDMLKMKLDIDMEGEFYYDGKETTGEGGENPEFVFNELITLISQLAKINLFENPNFRIAIDTGGINAVYKIKTHIHLDLEDFNNMKITLELYREGEGGDSLRLGLYVDGNHIYVDLSPLGLPKLAIKNVNLGTILGDAVGGLLSKLGGGDSKGNAALAAGVTDLTKFGGSLLSGQTKPYFTLIFRDNAWAFGMNGRLLNVLLAALGEVIGTDIALPEDFEMALIVDSSNANNPEGIGKPLPELRFTIGKSFILGIKMTDIHLNANMQTAPVWETAASVFERSVNAVAATPEETDDFITAYDVSTGEIGLARVNLGFDIKIENFGKNKTPSDDDYADSMDFYLYALFSSLFNNPDFGFAFNVNNSEDVNGNPIAVSGADIKLRASLNIMSLVSALRGGGDDWWGDIELYLDLKPMGYERSLISVFKMADSGDVYVDLSGLGLPKLKITGLGSLLGGLAGSASVYDMSTGSALATGGGNAAAGGTSAEEANLKITFGQGHMQIDIGMGVINGILGLIGQLDMDTKTFSRGTAQDVEFKTIVIGRGTTSEMHIPLPKLSKTKALSLKLKYPEKLEGVDITLGLDDFTSIGNSIRVAIYNFELSTREGYVNNGPEGSNEDVFGTYVTGEGVKKEWSGIILNDAKGMNLVNILKGVLGGITPNLSIEWNRKTKYKWRNNNSFNSSNASERTAPTYTNITLERTTAASKDGRGNNVFAGKLQVNIDIKSSDNAANRLINVWLFNNAVYLDISKLVPSLSWILGQLGYNQFKVTDLNLIELIGGLTSSSGGAASADGEALATAEEPAQTNILATIGNLIKGIEINWWYNNSVPELGERKNGTASPKGDKNITTVRIDIKPDMINDLFINLYYMLYGLCFPDAAVTQEAFKLLPYTDRYRIVTGDRNATFTGVDGQTYTSVDAYRLLVPYLQQFLAKFLAEMTGTAILGDALGLGGVASGVLRDVVGGLLPLPLLDVNKPSYIELVFDKSKDRYTGEGNERKGLIREIGVYLNKDKSVASGNNFSYVDVSSRDESAEIIIKLDNLEMRSVTGVKDYDNPDNTIPEVDTDIVYVEDPFNPVELTEAALSSNSKLIQKVDATFNGITEYTSKGQNGQHNNNMAILGGTQIVWDTSTVRLVPGEKSFMTGYALNFAVQTVEVQVGAIAGFQRLYGYINAHGDFVSANKITVDPTKDPSAAGATTVAQLPGRIVIMRRDGELQMLDTEYKKETVYTPIEIEGKLYAPVGKFGWEKPSETAIRQGGNIQVDFWYQAGNSSRIKQDGVTVITVTYDNSSIAEGRFPEGDKFGILSGGSASGFTAKNMDIKLNLGLGSIPAASIVKNLDPNDNTIVLSYTYRDSDGSEYVFIPDTPPTDPTELAEWNKHTIGLSGTFTRTFGGKTITGTYAYRAAQAVAGGLLGGLLGGGSSTDTTDKGSYRLTHEGGLKTLQVVLANGLLSNVDIDEWKYDGFDYDMTRPELGAKGTITAVIKKYEYRLNATTMQREIIPVYQNLEMKVNIERYQLDALVDGTLKLNQYEDLFEKIPEGEQIEAGEQTYFLETRNIYVAFNEKNVAHQVLTQYVFLNNEYVVADPDNTLHSGTKYVIEEVQAFVANPDKTARVAAANEYSCNVFEEDDVKVRVKYSRIKSGNELFVKDDFALYTQTDVNGNNIFVVPALSGSTDLLLRMKAVYNNGQYSQTFDIKARYSPKTVDRAAILVAKTTGGGTFGGTGVTAVADIVYFNDGTSLNEVALINIVVVGTDEAGVKLTTATVVKYAVDGTTVLAEFTQADIILEVRVY